MKGTAAIVGVGNMGGAMAARLLECGWRVQVRDVVPPKMDALVALGARAARSAGEAARGADALVVCVVDARQCDEVLFGADGAVPQLARGSVVLLCPTIAPQDTERIAAALHEHGLAVIDAPMSGGAARAREGSMSLMVACAEAVYARHQGLLEDLGSRIFRVGERIGDGARTKLVNNLLAGINLAGAAQALALAERLGLDAARTLDVMEQSSGQSWIASDRLRRAVAGDYAPRAHVTLLHKDTGLALQAAQAAGFAAPLGEAAHAAFAQAVAAGQGERDDAILFELFRTS